MRNQPGNFGMDKLAQRIAWRFRTAVREMMHGTSTEKLEEILSGSEDLSGRTYGGRWKSLGGAYLTTDVDKAEHYAREAAKEHGGEPVVLTVQPRKPLTPNEDWVRSMSNYYREEGPYGEFFNELYELSEQGEPLEITYRKNFDYLNDKHRITWEDSLHNDMTVRQTTPLTADQIQDARRADTGEDVPLEQ